MLAHHWRSALELARASGRDGADLAERTRFALREAGDRAFALNAFAAAANGTTTKRWRSGPRTIPSGPRLLSSRAGALHIAGDERREAALEEAREAVLAAGDDRDRGRDGGVPRARGMVPGHAVTRPTPRSSGAGARCGTWRVRSEGPRSRVLGSSADACGTSTTRRSRRRARRSRSPRRSSLDELRSPRADDDRLVQDLPGAPIGSRRDRGSARARAASQLPRWQATS